MSYEPKSRFSGLNHLNEAQMLALIEDQQAEIEAGKAEIARLRASRSDHLQVRHALQDRINELEGREAPTVDLPPITPSLNMGLAKEMMEGEQTPEIPVRYQGTFRKVKLKRDDLGEVDADTDGGIPRDGFPVYSPSTPLAERLKEIIGRVEWLEYKLANAANTFHEGPHKR